MSIVKNIKLLCKRGATSIPDLEKALGFGKGSIYKWDTNYPSTDRVQKVARYFEVSIDFILTGRESFAPFNSETILKIARENRSSIGAVITVLDETKSQVLNGQFITNLNDSIKNEMEERK